MNDSGIKITGMRTIFRRTSNFQVGVDNDGKIQYLNATIVEDYGCANNDVLLAFTVGSFPNCYNSDNFSLKTASVNTDLAARTFVRSPGI